MTYEHPCVLGVDPDTKHDGLCLLAPSGRLLELAVLPHRGGDAALIHDVQGVLAHAVQVAAGNGGRLVLGIEGQFLGKNAQSVMQLVEVRRTWEVLAVQHDIEVVRLDPATWRSLAFPGTNPIGTKRNVWKALAQGLLQREELGRSFQGNVVRVDADAADAYCIARAARMRLRGSRA